MLKNETHQIQEHSGVLALKSEFRFDTTTGNWTTIVEGRGARPSNTSADNRNVGFDAEPFSLSDSIRKHCVFCPGNEVHTPEVIVAAYAKDGIDEGAVRSLEDIEFVSSKGRIERRNRLWYARCVENKYPAFRMTPDASFESHFSIVESSFVNFKRDISTRFFNCFPSSGRHEVIIDTNRHARSWSDFSDFEIKLTFRLFRLRLKQLLDSRQFSYAFVFKNVGVNAGASQQHSHCQLTGNIDLPQSVRAEFERLAVYDCERRAHFETRSYWDALLDAELEANERIVWASDRFVVYCPYASRFPMQVEICPRFDGLFEEYEDETLDELAIIARRTVVALEIAKQQNLPNDPTPLDYNIIMRNVPWRLDEQLLNNHKTTRPRWIVLPSLVKKAGYEIGCGIDINPIAPETAANVLRKIFATQG